MNELKEKIREILETINNDEDYDEHLEEVYNVIRDYESKYNIEVLRDFDEWAGFIFGVGNKIELNGLVLEWQNGEITCK